MKFSPEIHDWIVFGCCMLAGLIAPKKWKASCFAFGIGWMIGEVIQDTWVPTNV